MTMKPEPIKTFLDNRKNFIDTVNSCKEKLNTETERVTSNSNSIDEDRIIIQNKFQEFLYKPEALAKELAEKLDDEKSYKFYLTLARNSNQNVLLDILACTVGAYNEGRLRRPRPIYFMSILQRKGIRTKFRSE